jgi:hypothetical protein
MPLGNTQIGNTVSSARHITPSNGEQKKLEKTKPFDLTQKFLLYVKGNKPPFVNTSHCKYKAFCAELQHELQ